MHKNQNFSKPCCDAKMFVMFEFYLKEWLKSEGIQFSKHKSWGLLIKKVIETNKFEARFDMNDYNLEQVHHNRNAYMHSHGTKKAELSPGNRDKIYRFIMWCKENL